METYRVKAEVTELNRCEQECIALAYEIERLRAALKGLSDMYARTWDLTDGGLTMLAGDVDDFEAAHERARIALGEELDGDRAADETTPVTAQANTPICPKCGQLDIRIPRMNVYHVCPSETEPPRG